MSTSSRTENIRRDLDALQARGCIRSWYAYAPGDRGRVWVVEHAAASGMVGTDSLSTREAEVLIRGIRAGEAALDMVTRSKVGVALREYADEIVSRSHTDANIARGDALRSLAETVDPSA